MVKCPICDANAAIIFKKKEYNYYECRQCKTVFIPGGIDQSDMVGGGAEVERNTVQNAERINRFVTLIGLYGRILDYGCGHAMLVEDCAKAGLVCKGFDKFNPEFDKMPEGKFNLVSMVEVIEHLHSPFGEIDSIRDKLVDNGVVYIETSFVDIANQEKIPLEEFFYIEPAVGHGTIFSHEGLDLLMIKKGFTSLEHINRNVRIYQKK